MGPHEFVTKAQELLECADEDLRVSRLSYENGIYRQALYHLEQASEKIIKAYFISVWCAQILREAEILASSDDLKGACSEVAEGLRNLASEYCPGTVETLKKVLNHRIEKGFGNYFERFLDILCSNEEGLECISKAITAQYYGEEVLAFSDEALREYQASICRSWRDIKSKENKPKGEQVSQVSLKEIVDWLEGLKESIEKVAEKNANYMAQLAAQLTAGEGAPPEDELRLFKESEVIERLIEPLVMVLHSRLSSYYDIRYCESEVKDEEIKAIPKITELLGQILGIVRDLVKAFSARYSEAPFST